MMVSKPLLLPLPLQQQLLLQYTLPALVPCLARVARQARRADGAALAPEPSTHALPASAMM